MSPAGSLGDWWRAAEAKSQNTLGSTPCAEVSRPATRGSGGAGLRTGLNPGNRAASGSGLAPGWRACYWRHGLWLSESLGMWAWIQVGAHLSARLYLLSLLAGAQACLFRTVSIVGFSALWFLKLPWGRCSLRLAARSWFAWGGAHGGSHSTVMGMTSLLLSVRTKHVSSACKSQRCCLIINHWKRCAKISHCWSTCQFL